jgi:hypothetical protein
MLHLSYVDLPNYKIMRFLKIPHSTATIVTHISLPIGQWLTIGLLSGDITLTMWQKSDLLCGHNVAFLVYSRISGSPFCQFLHKHKRCLKFNTKLSIVLDYLRDWSSHRVLHSMSSKPKSCFIGWIVFFCAGRYSRSARPLKVVKFTWQDGRILC